MSRVTAHRVYSRVSGIQTLKAVVKRSMTRHRQSHGRNILIFSTARSGTTWLTELLATQDRFKIVNEPFNLRQPVNQENLGIETWDDLLKPENRPSMKTYLESFIAGTDRDLRYNRPTPFSDKWHFRTTRIIFKILFAGEDSVNWFRELLNARVVLLLRHPIPVSLSREELPRLHSFLKPPYSDHFRHEQKAFAQSVVDRGDELETAVLDWCLQNAVRLRSAEPDWLVLGYEQLVLEPEIVIPIIADRLEFSKPEKMLDRLYTPSGSTWKSSDESKELLRDPETIRQNRRGLVERWKSIVSKQEESRLLAILEAFDIDFYEYGNPLPKEKYLLT